ncbi:hypothetical protein RF11_16426 [Thelohanellus kitauei]|uniref:Uncharacterized protein n=1 Tax=Thelohanellus kitauei TaxID=669202 RepID=A0A0C2JZ89_THEKT|nr:hypothetical protein RF11_16426 [Thelohanellus kitauei]
MSEDAILIIGTYKNLKSNLLHTFGILHSLIMDKLSESEEILQSHSPLSTTNLKLKLELVKNPKAYDYCKMNNRIFECNNKNEIICRDPYKDIYSQCKCKKF